MHPSVVVAVAALLGALLSYGLASLLLGEHADRVRSPGYLTGFALQGVAFLLAFVARTQLPLILVQSTISASVAVTALAGVMLGRWRLDRRDCAALATVIGGIAAVGASSRPGPVTVTGWTCLTTVAIVAMLSALGLVWRPRRAPEGGRGDASAIRAAGLLGVLAGLSFGSSAIAARMVASDPIMMVRSPIGMVQAAVLIGGLAIGQVLLTSALRVGRTGPGPASSHSVTVPVSAVYIAGTLWPAAAGLIWLGDLLAAGRAELAVLGVVLALVGVSALSRTGRPLDRTARPVTSNDPPRRSRRVT